MTSLFVINIISISAGSSIKSGSAHGIKVYILVEIYVQQFFKVLKTMCVYYQLIGTSIAGPC